MTTASTATRSTVDVLEALERAYDDLLRRCFRGFDEATLHDAHELGREGLALGLGVLDMVEIHHRLLSTHLARHAPVGVPQPIDAAGRLLVETLTPFEMVHRGFRTANRALRLSEDRYRDLFQNANDAIFTANLDGTITSLNRAGERLTGYSHDEAVTLHVSALLANGNSRQNKRFQVRQLATLADHGRYEVDIMTRDGRRVPVEVSTRRIYEADKLIGIQGIARDITDRRNAESALRHLNSRLEEKAKRIAHGLHDEAGQLLASVYLRVAEIASELPTRDRRRVEDLRTLLDQVDDQIRRLAHELRPSVLDELGLIPACQWLAEGVSKRGGIRVTVTGSTKGRLDPEHETALYRVVQEALANVVRHAQARTATVKIERVGHRLRGVIRDDGQGFDLTKTSRRPGHGLGLIGMRERLAAFGGRLDVTSTPGSGTTIDFEIPLED